ncbi:unnamed protein product [Durusdinium trenchii]|uniref:Uncharacterized protein n=1 Tax=Durusdinium trenchii TaxID=1381693 RepID=A0ABP0JSI4_9DINO
MTEPGVKVCCLMDEQARLLYCVVTSSLSYPERQAYQLLYDFRGLVERDNTNELDESEAHSLNDKLEAPMRELVKKYENVQDGKMSTTNIPDTSSAPLNHQDLQAANGKKWILLVAVAVVIILILYFMFGRGSSDSSEKKEDEKTQIIFRFL